MKSLLKFILPVEVGTRIRSHNTGAYYVVTHVTESNIKISTRSKYPIYLNIDPRTFKSRFEIL